MSKTVKEFFGLNAVAIGDPSKIYKQTVDIIDSDEAVGIEVEVEAAQHDRNPNPNVWVSKGDGSLRNNGIEWITVPIPARWAPAALDDLLGNCLSKSCCFSPRTSIHVHVDMQKYETHQVMDVVLLYTLLESALYQYTGRGRIKNIYCVPVFDTSMLRGQAGRGNLSSTLQGWSKYSGLNLLRLADLGTIEFRHMHGTFDSHKVAVWIRLLIKLCTFARDAGTEHIRKLVQSSEQSINVQSLLREVFGGDADVFAKDVSVTRGLDACRTAFIGNRTLDTYGANARAKSGAYFNFKGAV
jgi:Putative amidoligase enzyme